MTKSIVWFFCAFLFSGVSQSAHIVSQQSVHAGAQGSALELIQLGGTGGLIVCLLMGVIALWKDRLKIMDMMSAERAEHHARVERLNESHHKASTELTSRLIQEMKDRVEELKRDADDRYQKK